MIAVEGEGTIDQGGRCMPFRKGDITFRTTRLPSTCTLTSPGKLVMLRLPSDRFFGIYADLHDRFVPSIAQADSRLAEAAPRAHGACVSRYGTGCAGAGVFFGAVARLAAGGDLLRIDGRIGRRRRGRRQAPRARPLAAAGSVHRGAPRRCGAVGRCGLEGAWHFEAAHAPPVRDAAHAVRHATSRCAAWSARRTNCRTGGSTT